MKDKIIKLVESWANIKGNINSNDEILEWVSSLNIKTKVSVEECSINENSFWFYDD